MWTNREFPFYSEHGLGSSPILWEDLLIMARDGSHPRLNTGPGWRTAWDQAHLLALDKYTGRVRWKTRRGLSRLAHVVPNLWPAPDGHVEVISGAGDVVQGFDAKTGQRLWTSRNMGEGVGRRSCWAPAWFSRLRAGAAASRSGHFVPGGRATSANPTWSGNSARACPDPVFPVSGSLS